MPDKIIKVSKLDAARRQLDTAIDLWFQEGDPISIGALVHNAHQILQDLNVQKGNKHFTTLEMARRHASEPEDVERIMQLSKKPVTFLKHANRDPHDILEFRPEAAEMLIVLSIYGLELLGEQVSDLIRAFTLWQSLHRPHIFLKGGNPVENGLSAEERAGMREIKKRNFLEQALLGYAKGRSRR